MEMRTQRTHLWARVGGEEGEGEMERSMDTYALPYVKQIASGNFAA